MKTTDSAVLEAYVIENDGSKTAVPIGFADEKPRAKRAASPAGGAWQASTAHAGRTRPPFAPFAGGAGPFAGATVAPRRKLHLGRRLAGVAIALVGVPLLILPGPGLALIGLGLLMATMP